MVHVVTNFKPPAQQSLKYIPGVSFITDVFWLLLLFGLGRF